MLDYEQLRQTMLKCRARRQALAISAYEFGRALGVSGSAILSWETLRNKPKAFILKRIVDLLDDLEAGRKDLPRSYKTLSIASHEEEKAHQAFLFAIDPPEVDQEIARSFKVSKIVQKFQEALDELIAEAQRD